MRLNKRAGYEGTGPGAITPSAEPVGDGVNSVHAEYEFPDATWTQTFLARPLTADQFAGALAKMGLTVDTYLTEDRTWARASRVA